MMKSNYKETIIQFVENSHDDDNLRIAIFIAGMQAQKNLSSLCSQQKEPQLQSTGT